MLIVCKPKKRINVSILRAIKRKMTIDKYDFDISIEILFGGNGLPQRYDYMEGYKMVKSYPDLHPNTQPMEWTGLTGKEIFEGGNYAEHYQ
ncbi:DUF2268 domain-containing putative Zn-dependent protease [Bacillus sp. SCS-153A]|uniref:DUF2268 domain-containing putative Zn-dependent protease n=1 Tax=Rossellomorea sedimentorum TaxID=3115294 RepID=UPI0039063B4D